jgi:Fe-S oxidoreductase
LLDKRIDYSDKLLDVVYNCQMCGACDVSCKYAMDMEVLEPLNELRIQCVEEGRIPPALGGVIDNLRKRGTMALNEGLRRGDWARELDVKDANRQKVQVLYHAGCRADSDKTLWRVAQDSIILLQKAGADVGILGDQEQCCGGRAYQMGYKKDFLKQVGQTLSLIQQTGAKTVVTGCAECYHAFNFLYDKFGLKGKLKVLHTSQYLERLIKEGKLKPAKKVAMKVTYHDPCHLGRQGEPYIRWKGKPVAGQIRIFDPPKEYRRGTYGIYEAPRNILRSIPGLKLIEMERVKEYAWCCGSGGGVAETNPAFARWTAGERISEAESTGADILATACPGCQRSFKRAIQEKGSRLLVSDVIELFKKAV